MGWQIPICQKGRRPLKEVCLTAFAESEFDNGLANSDLPKRSETFERSMPHGICRIGVRQPTYFSATHFLCQKGRVVSQRSVKIEKAR